MRSELLKQWQRKLWQRLTALALSALLMAACGGGADPESVSAESFESSADAQTQRAAGWDGVDSDDADAAVLDLGLVDPNRGVRISTASADSGVLSVEQFGSALLDESPSVRQAAVDGIVGSPPEVLLARLPHLKQAFSDLDEGVRESAVEALSGWDDPRAISLLLEARGDASPLVREEAREALAEPGSAGVQRLDEIPFNSGD